MSDSIDPGPVITLEARYGYPAQWFDMTCDVFGLRFRRGRPSGGPQSWRSVMQAGELIVELDNSSGRYSTFYGDGDLVLGEGTVLRLRCEWKGQHIPLFVGYVEDWKERWTQDVDRVLLTAVDPIGVLAEQGGAFEWVPGAKDQMVRARIEQLLNRAGVRGEPFYSHRGSIYCISPKLKNRTVLDEIYATCLSDFGVFFHEPAPITNPASATEPHNNWVYLDRNRFASVVAADGAPVPTVPVGTDAVDWRQVAGPADRVVGAITRRAQGAVPVFTDACLQSGDREHGYRDIEWAYIAYERPSLIGVTNAAPPEERDDAGNLALAPWVQSSAVVPVNSARHKIITLTDLRFTGEQEAQDLAISIATQLGKPKLEVSRLRLWPHSQPGEFDELLKLRLQDHVITVRNLIHGDRGTRIEIDSLVEGFDISLRPRPEWSTGEHFAEWDVSLLLSPVVADIEDVPLPPPTLPPQPPKPPAPGEPPPPPVDVVTLLSEGTGSDGLPATGWIDRDNYRVLFTSTLLTNRVMVGEAVNVLTGTGQQLSWQDNAGGHITRPDGTQVIADRLNASGLTPGVTYRLRLVDPNLPTRFSNWITMSPKPLPTPPRPSVIRADSWALVPYQLLPDMTHTPTSIEWPVNPGLNYQIGIKENHNPDTNYAAQPIQSSNLFVTSLANDTNYSIALRYVQGGTFSPWSEPLRLAMGHPARINVSEFKMLARTVYPDPGVSYKQFFTCDVPYTPGPPAGEGDGQWHYSYMTNDWAYINEPYGFIGTNITELHIRAYNKNIRMEQVGEKLCVPAYGVVTSYIVGGDVWDPEGSGMIPTSVPNPTWGGEYAAQGFWRAPVSLGVCDMNDRTRSGVTGLIPYGEGYRLAGIYMSGSVEAWGRVYTPQTRQRHRIV
jgi:hypothetical protein